MRYLKTYKIFESGNASFDWLINQNNERYLDLMDILQSEVFDEFNIISKTDESFEMGHGEIGYPYHKFWSFRLKDSKNTNDDISDVNLIGDKEISEIIVFNIESEIVDEFWDKILSCKERVQSVTNKKLVISEEPLGGPEQPEFYDYIIKLE